MVGQHRPLRNSKLGTDFLLGALAFVWGCGWITFQSIGWYIKQQTYAFYAPPVILGVVREYYIAEALAICVLVAGLYLIYRALVSKRDGFEPSDLRAILASALSSRRDLMLGVVAAVAYAAVYLVVSSIVVYQPGVNFGAAYGVTSTSWNAAACCGEPGTVPSVYLFLSPAAHLAVQLMPLDALFAVLVPILVGLNVTVVAYAVRSSEVRGKGRWVGSIGVLTGLFTGCPTCAGLFLAGSLGGAGATTIAVALAPYQLLFVFVSIPLLLVSPLINAFSIRRSIFAACPVPSTEPR